MVKEADGYLWTEDYPEAHIAWAGHETFMLPLLKSLLPPGGVFVDVGAHVGRYTVRMADLARIVYAFEPHPQNREALNANLAANAIPNVVVLPFAADAAWRAGSLSDAGASSKFYYESEDGFPVLTCPLDILPAADLIKIDVEGHEGSVLRGARGLIQRSQPSMVIEIHPGTRVSVESTLNQVKYFWEEIGKFGSSEYWLCQPIN